MTGKDERTVTTEDIVSGLYVEMLASDINKVKLNRIYKENEEQAYLKMKTSKLNEYKFIKQATIKKTVEFKKAIGLIELMKEYENSLDMKYVRETDEKDMDSDVLTKIRFIEELGGIVLGTYKGLEDLVENLEGVIDELESTSQVQDRVQVEVRDRCEIDKEIKDTINKSEVAQLGLSPLQNIVDEVCEIDYEIDCEIDCETEIYVIGGYDRLINKLRAKFVNIGYIVRYGVLILVNKPVRYFLQKISPVDEL